MKQLKARIAGILDGIGAMSSLLKRQAGSAVVEFAVLTPVLLLMVLGITDFGRAMNYFNNATHLANEGARWAAVDVNPGSGTSLQNYIRSQGDTTELRNDSTVCIDFPTNPQTGTSQQIGDPVEVTVSVAFGWMPYINNKALGGSTPSTTMVGKAVMRLEQQSSNYAAGCSA